MAVKVSQANDKVHMRTEGLGRQSSFPLFVTRGAMHPLSLFSVESQRHLTPCKLQMLQECILSATRQLGTPGC